MVHSSRCAWGWILLTLLIALPTASSLAADDGWEFLNGPQGAFVRELERAPSDPQILYAATWGDVYKSIDGGVTWQSLGVGEGSSEVAVHPQNSSIVLAGTDFGKLARSIDGGATWAVQRPPFLLGRPPVLGLEIDPSAPDTAYALFAGADFSAPIVKTVDGGVTWTEASVGLELQEDPPIYRRVTALALHPQDPSILYTLDDFGQLYQSVDGAEAWARVPNIGMNQSGAATLEIDPSDTSYFFAGLFTGGVYRSDDGGIHWTRSNEGLAAAFTQDFAFPSAERPIMYGATLRGIYRSDNRAESWFPVNGGISDWAMATVLVDPSDGQHLHAGGAIGVFETMDGGTTWNPRTQGMEHRFVSHLVVDRSDPSTVLAATRSGVLHRSTDGGATWPLIRVEGLFSGFIGSLAAAPSEPSRIYLGASSKRVFRSSDGGVSWTEVLPAGRDFNLVQALAVHPSDPQTVVAGLGGSTGRVLLSSDGGISWSSGIGLPFGPVHSVAFDRQNPSILYAGHDFGIYKSTDGGANWSQLPAWLPENSFQRLELTVDPRSSSTLYVATEFVGLFRSMDGGESWQAIDEGLPTLRINTLLIDPDDSAVLYCALFGGGVYRSLDRGETWTPFNDGFPALELTDTVNVNAMATGSSAPDRTLYAGLFHPEAPSGVYGRSVPFPSLFADGFESGDLSAWSSSASAP